MPKPAAFVLPSGLKLDLTGDTLNIEYDGDIRIEEDLGKPIGRVRAGGDLTIKLAKVTGDIEAAGEVHIQGEIDAVRIYGRTVVLGRQRAKATAITAQQTITIGASELRVDAIVAPEIRLDPKASGRVTVIESLNERGATKIKGGFSMADYDDMFGNAEDFLAERGISPLDRSASPMASTLPAAEPEPEADSDDEDTSDEKTVMTRSPSTQEDEEDVDDPLSLSLDDLEPLMEQALGDSDSSEDTHQRLAEGLARITASYDADDLPPAVEELRHLIVEKDYAALRQNITEIWNGLLGFHQKRGIRPHPQVTHAFNLIHSIVQG